MAFQFVGDIESVSKLQLGLLKTVIEDNGIKKGFVRIEPLGKPGDNYQAHVKRIIAEDENGEIFKMVAKIAATQEALRSMMNITVIFQTETAMYTEVLPKLLEIQKKACIPEENHIIFAKCYGFISEAPHEMILLEDLNEVGFTMLERQKSLSDDEIKLVLKQLATLHSLSYVVRYKYPEVFEDFKSRFENLRAKLAGIVVTEMFFVSAEKFSLELLESDEHRAKVKGTVINIPKYAAMFHKYDCTSKYSVLIQGDCWTNNIMFRFERDTAAACTMIDYQQSRNSSPAVDLLNFIFNCSDYATRSAYYFDWLEYYHNKLAEYLSEHGLNAYLVYPREKLDSDLRIHGKYAFGMAALLNNLLLVGSEETLDLKGQMDDELSKTLPVIDSDALMSFKVSDETKQRLKTRLQGLYQSFEEYGYL